MSNRNLEDLIQAAGGAVNMLRNLPAGPNPYPGIPPEFTNWRDEQEAWQKTCVLFTLSYHMAELTVEGPDAVKLLSSLSINTFKNLNADRAKQFVPCSPEGYVIGDVIMYPLAENRFNLVGRIPALNWIRFHGETGKYNVKMELDERSAARPDPFGRRFYRFQVQGPNAMKLMEKVLGAAPPTLKFFHLCDMTIAGKKVRALRHGMAGQAGFELFGPYAEGPAVREALVKAGEEFGLRQSGGRAYSSNTLESGWIPSPLAAIYSGEKTKAYRQWLSADCYEAKASIGGSFLSKKIEDYYLTPWDMSYGTFIDFDHEFVGRDALQQMAKGHRRKVTLVLDNGDVMKVLASQFEKGDRGKFIEFPSAVYSMHPYDKVTSGGKTAGISTWVGYSSTERKMLTIAILDEAYATPGTKVSLTWGEENGGTKKGTVEKHSQMEIGATVHPAPYVEVVRKTYTDRGGWRAT